MSDKVGQLQVLFPQFEREVLESVLHIKKDDVDDSIDALLAMDSSGRHHNSNDPDLHVGVRPRPSKRTIARQRLRQRKRNQRQREAQAKKVKWVRFSPFVTAIAKLPLKDDNTFIPLLEEREEDDNVVGNWEELAEKEPKEAEPHFFALDLEKEKDKEFPPLPSFFFASLSSPEKETPVVPDEKEKQIDNVAGDFTLININSSLSSSFIEANGGDDFVSVKLYLSDTDIRRLGIRKSDPSAFEKLRSSIMDDPATSSSVFAPKYIDEEKERVTVRSQEEFEECLRVHAEFIWPTETQQRTSAPILRLYL